jgi:hypothetical protein
MNEFVEACRREWRRLGVPDSVAAEMAADLEADLDEAAAEGVSAEVVLGSSAFDPRSFAASWAAERGVIGQTPRMRRRSHLPAAIAAFALVALVGAGLAIFASPSASQRIAVGPPTSVVVTVPRIPPPLLRVPRWRSVVVPAPLPGRHPQVFAVETDASGNDLRSVGLVLLLAGVVGTIGSMLFWLFGDAGRWPRGPTYA